MSEESEKQRWFSASSLNCAVLAMDLATVTELRTRTHQEKVKELESALHASCDAVAGRLERLRLYCVAFSLVLHWEGKKEPYAWLSLDTSTAGEIVLQLASMVPGHEKRICVRLEPFATVTGAVRVGWALAPDTTLHASEFADHCVVTLLDYCAGIVWLQTASSGSSHQPQAG